MRLAWSNLVRQEMEALRRLSFERWGAVVAARYLDDIRIAAKRVSADPSQARPLKGPYRILRVRSH